MSSPKLKKKTDLHFARYAFHAFSGVLLAVLCYQLPKPTMVSLLAAIAVFMIGHDFYRLRVPTANDRVIKITSAIMRDSERHSLASSSFYIAGCFLTVLVFSGDIAVQAILFLALGDPAAAWFGNRFAMGKITPRKSIGGSGMCFCVCALVTIWFHFSVDVAPFKFAMLIVLSGAVGMLAELIAVARLNDNLTMPLISGAGLLVVGSYFDQM